MAAINSSPRVRSRLTLIVEAVKIESLLAISEDDARAEGFEAGQLNDGFGPRDFGGGCTIESPGTYASAAGMFQITWAKLHPEWGGYSSPDVVAVSFRVVKANIDLLKQGCPGESRYADGGKRRPVGKAGSNIEGQARS